MIPETITYAEAAERYGCNSRTIRRAVLDGKIEAYRPGKEVQLVLTSADKWYLSTRVRPIGRPRGNRRR